MFSTNLYIFVKGHSRFGALIASTLQLFQQYRSYATMKASLSNQRLDGCRLIPTLIGSDFRQVPKLSGNNSSNVSIHATVALSARTSVHPSVTVNQTQTNPQLTLPSIPYNRDFLPSIV